MEEVTFAAFMVEYDRSSLGKCQNPAVLGCRNYSIEDVVSYKREHVMLHVPFRKKLDILDGNAFKKIFDDNKETIIEIKQRYSAGVTVLELISACEVVGRSEANHAEEVEQPEERPSAVPTLVDINDNSDLVPEKVTTKMQQNTSVLPWHHLSYFPLTEVVGFTGLLTKIGDGKELNGDEIRVLTYRFVTREQAAIQCPLAVCLFFSNNDVDVHNKKVAESCEYKHDSVAIHVVTGHRSRQEEREALARIQDLNRAESGNLPSVVTFCTKRPYMLLKNIDVTDGLVNGMVGMLMKVELNVDDTPKRVWLQYPSGVGTLTKAK
ncbi:hypothetical protein MRX96_045317, partial [Rhipicephalus microplus]